MGKLATMTNDDDARAIGENFRRIRTEAGWSMVDLAKKMNERGFNWTKVSVYKIETGERQLKVNEAINAFSVMGRDAGTSFARLTEVSDIDKQARDAIEETLRGIKLMLNYSWGGVAIGGRRNIKSIIEGKEWDDYKLPEDEMPKPSEEMMQRLREVEAATSADRVLEFLSRYMKDYALPACVGVDVIDGELCGLDDDDENINWLHKPTVGYKKPPQGGE